MTRKIHPLMKEVLLAAALAAAASGAARADDSSMNPFTGESYVYFNGGHEGAQKANPGLDRLASEWRRDNPSGLSERVLQSYSAPGEAWHLSTPQFASAASDPRFKQSHPNGLTEPELQALSSEAPAWQGRAGPMLVASADGSVVAQNGAPQSLGTRIASLLHLPRGGATR
jgi:hypothetical protein